MVNGFGGTVNERNALFAQKLGRGVAMQRDIRSGVSIHVIATIRQIRDVGAPLWSRPLDYCRPAPVEAMHKVLASSRKLKAAAFLRLAEAAGMIEQLPTGRLP